MKRSGLDLVFKEIVKASFLTSLQTLLEHCEFKDRRDQVILIQLIVGMKDGKLSKRLQLDDKMTLEKAKTQARQVAQIDTQQGVVRHKRPATWIRRMNPLQSGHPVKIRKGID